MIDASDPLGAASTGEGPQTAARDRHRFALLATRAVALTLIAALSYLVVTAAPWMRDPTAVGTDASNYYAAGQRLNDGHPLYRLGPGDLPVPMDPSTAGIPLISSPPIAVVWRPLAVLPRDLAIRVWWLAMTAVVIATAVWLTGSGSVLVSLAVAVLSWDLVLTAFSANINAVLIPLLSCVWLAFRANRRGTVGAIVAVAVALKVMPVVLVLWLLVQRRWTELRWFVVTAGALGLLSLAGAGIANHLDWLSVARSTGTTGVSGDSLAGFLEGFGLPAQLAPFVIPTVLAAGCAAIIGLRHRPGLGFAAAIVTMVYANPALHAGSLAVVLPALMPYAFPIDQASSHRRKAPELVAAPPSP
jgi:hypothetical protein